jgi:hypothetical protein
MQVMELKTVIPGTVVTVPMALVEGSVIGTTMPSESGDPKSEVPTATQFVEFGQATPRRISP